LYVLIFITLELGTLTGFAKTLFSAVDNGRTQ